MYKHRFSVFTATYNRSDLLPIVYKNLLGQTFKDFEWVVVDDGSTDKTEEIMNVFIRESKIPIKYVKKANGGKHSAWKVATDLFEGRYIACADDDDTLLSNALEVFDKEWSILEKNEQYANFWEVRTRCMTRDGKLVGKPFDKPYFDSDYNEFVYKMKNGPIEFCSCRKVEVLRDIAAVPNNIIHAKKISNFPECIRWSRAARKGYKTRYVDTVTRIYNDTTISLSRAKKSEKSIYNNLVLGIYLINEQRDLLFKYDLKRYIYTALNVSYQSVRLKQDNLKYLNHFLDKFICFLLYPLAAIIYIFRK